MARSVGLDHGTVRLVPYDPTWPAFRDYLRSHPSSRDEYARLKHALAARFPADRGSYIDAKGPFVRAVLERAAQAADD